MRYAFLTFLCCAIIIATNFETFKASFQFVIPKPEVVWQIGDCYYLDFSTQHESWETKPRAVHKIVQISETAYWSAVRVKVDGKYYWVISTDRVEDVKKYGVKITCPETADNQIYVIGN